MTRLLHDYETGEDLGAATAAQIAASDAARNLTGGIGVIDIDGDGNPAQNGHTVWVSGASQLRRPRHLDGTFGTILRWVVGIWLYLAVPIWIADNVSEVGRGFIAGLFVAGIVAMIAWTVRNNENNETP